jgi:repressor LexA
VPTIREIGLAFGIVSTNGVNDHLRALQRKGFIRMSAGMKSRDLRILKLPDGTEVVPRLVPRSEARNV